MRSLAAAVAAFALGACIDDKELPRYSCDLSQVAGYAFCTEFGPLDDYGTSYNEWYCTSSGGTWGTAPCPAANRVASCAMPPSQGGSTQYWYANYTGNLADVEQQCTMYGGTWTTYGPP